MIIRFVTQLRQFENRVFFHAPVEIDGEKPSVWRLIMKSNGLAHNKQQSIYETVGRRIWNTAEW